MRSAPSPAELYLDVVARCTADAAVEQARKSRLWTSLAQEASAYVRGLAGSEQGKARPSKTSSR